MKHAKKIQLAGNFPTFKKSSVVLNKHGTWDATDKHHVVRSYVPRKHVESVCNVLPKNIIPYILGVNFSEILLLAPHIHTQDQCVINFYQHVNGEITSFWDGEIEQDDRWASDNGNNYINVNHEKIKLIESFIAQDGDVWILNTRQPHSVSIDGDMRVNNFQYVPQNDNKRVVIQVFMDMPYEELVVCFNEELTLQVEQN